MGEYHPCLIQLSHKVKTVPQMMHGYDVAENYAFQWSFFPNRNGIWRRKAFCMWFLLFVSTLVWMHRTECVDVLRWDYFVKALKCSSCLGLFKIFPSIDLQLFAHFDKRLRCPLPLITVCIPPSPSVSLCLFLDERKRVIFDECLSVFNFTTMQYAYLEHYRSSNL